MRDLPAYQYCARTLLELDKALVALRRQLVDPRYDLELPAYVVNEEGEHAVGYVARDRAANVLTQIDYLDGQAPTTVLTMRGAVMCSLPTIEAAKAVNAAKKAFMQARRAAISKIVKWEDGTEITLFDAFLRLRGRARLHHNQARRQIITTEDIDILAVGWSQSRAPGITRYSAGELLEHLIGKHESTHRNADIERLASLPANTPLAKKRKGAVVNIANIQTGTRGTLTIKTSLPILIHGEEMVHYLPIRQPAIGMRRRRADALLEIEPFLLTEPVYRYRADPEQRNKIRIAGYSTLLSILPDNLSKQASIDEATAWELYRNYIQGSTSPEFDDREAKLVAKLAKRHQI